VGIPLVGTVVRAVFFTHAALAVACVLLKSSERFVARSQGVTERISAMPISSRVIDGADAISSFWTGHDTRWKAKRHPSSHRSLNWDALIPGYAGESPPARHRPLRRQLPFDEGLTESGAAHLAFDADRGQGGGKARICASESPTCLPAPARRRDSS
jgi:hypothetical protein